MIIYVYYKIVGIFLCILWLQMYRIKDPKVSLDFYSRVLGMS